MDRRSFIKSLFLATATAQTTFMVSKYGLPNPYELGTVDKPLLVTPGNFDHLFEGLQFVLNSPQDLSMVLPMSKDELLMIVEEI